jgi:tetratricopeptide (TPR) repeat protein
MKQRPLLRAVALTVTSLFAAPAFADEYDDALAAARALDAQGRPREAAAVLAEALPRYPQDYALPLAAGDYELRAGRFVEAERRYWTALERSPRGPEALFGLALALERQGLCAEATVAFERVLAEQPGHEEALRGLSRCAPQPAFRAALSLAGNGGYYPGAPYRRFSAGGLAAAEIGHRSGFFLGAAYRYLHFVPASGAAVSAWDQHEAYASLGYAAARFGLSLHYGFARDGSGALGDSHHLGLRARYSPFGDLELAASLSLYGDGQVYRVEPSWRIPLPFGFSVRPGVAVEVALGEVLATGLLTVSFDRGPVSLFAGGKYGDEVRPVYFQVPAIVDLTQKIAFGAWAGASVNVSDPVRIHLTYTLDRQKLADGSALDAHALTLGIGVSF